MTHNHVIRIKYNGDNAILEIDGVTMVTNTNVASLIEASIRTFATEWLMKVEDDVFVSPTDDTMRIVIRSNDNNEVKFVIEE
jgi:hypothetical protein